MLKFASIYQHPLRTFIRLIIVIFLATFIYSDTAHAATGINRQINFQGKVVNSDGTNVPDGNYDFEFKLYTVDTAGTAIWTETRTTANQVAVQDGVFRVSLGEVTALPGSVDFNTDNIYLSVNFNSDGEMSPRVRFTAVPYAFNAEKVAGLTVTNTNGTLTIPDSTITFSGANDVTLTSTGTTTLTLPTTGTLATLAGTETFSNKTIASSGLTVEDNTWIGLGSGTGRIEFDDQAVDEVNILGANVGIGTSAPTALLDVEGLLSTNNLQTKPALGSYYYEDTTGLVYDVAVVGEYAYIADGTGGLRVIDISNPADPVTLGTYNSPGTARGVDVKGSYAYLADGSWGFRVVDVSNPNAPALVGECDCLNDAYDVIVSGKYAYVADRSSGTRVFDISDPTLPTLITTYNGSGLASTLAIQDNYLFVNDDSTNGMIILDISDPTSPSLVGGPVGYAVSIAVNGRYAYISAGSTAYGISVVDISNPASPTIVGSVSGTLYSNGGLTVVGDYLYAVTQTVAEIILYDVSDPTSPAEIDKLQISGGVVGKGIVVNGNYAYAATGDTGLVSVELQGAVLPTLSSGSITTNFLNILGNGTTNGDFSVRGGLNVGHNALIDGRLAVVNKSYFGNNVGIGTTNPSRLLHVAGAMRLDTVSTPGTPVAGDIYSDGADLFFYNGSSWDDLTGAGGGGTSYWGLNNGALSPLSSSADVLIGSTASSSAKLAFLNINSGTPTASISGNLALGSPSGASPATFLNILNGGSFNLKGSVGGEAGLASRLFIDANGYLGIGNITSPTALLDVAGSDASRASMRLRSSTTAPASPNDGDIYYDTAKDSLMIYTGSKWQADRSSATLIVAASDSLYIDRADYVADGTADQTEIEAAITALPAGGGVVVLMEGTYSLSDDITITKSNVKLVGSGTATVLSKAWDQLTAETKGAITLGEDTSTYSGIEVRSLTLLGNKTTYTDVDNYGVYIAGKINESTVADITINDFAGAGIYSKGLGETNTGNVFSKNIIKNGGSYGIYLYYNNRKTLITDNYIYSNGNAGVYLRYDEDDSQIVNNRIESNTGAGIYIYQASSRLTISNNQIITNTSYGITMNSGSDNPLISGNVVSGNGNHGIDLTSVDQADISGNMVIGNTGRGINVYVSNYANVTGNTVNSNTTNGIRIDTASYANVTGNNLYANTGTGTDSSIYLTSSDNNSISGNRIVDTAGTGYAINIANSGSDTNYLASNYYTGTGATAINNAGTGTIYGGQTYGSDYVIAPTGNVGIGTTTITSKLDILTTTNQDILQLIGDSVTTSDGIDLSVDGLTTGYAINAQSTSTALTTGGLLDLDWTPGSVATASGDLFRLQIGAHADLTGNMLALYDSGNAIFKVSTQKITSGLPHEFTAAGDVSMAYDLILTNQTSANIQSNGPLTITSGENFENLDLTLQPSGSGAVVIDDGSNLELYADQQLIFDTDDGGNSYIQFDNTNNRVEIFADGSERFRFTASGNNESNGTITTTLSDVAENYPTLNADLEAGDVVVVTSQAESGVAPYLVDVSSVETKDLVVGVVSSKPGLVLGGSSFLSDICQQATVSKVSRDQITLDLLREEYKIALLTNLEETERASEAATLTEKEIGQEVASASLEELESVVPDSIKKTIEDRINSCDAVKQVPIALAGRVPVKFDRSAGDIKPGDLLMVSPTLEGHAVKATGTGWVIGRALEANDKDSETIMMFVSLSWYTGINSLENIADFGNDVLGSSISLDSAFSIKNVSGSDRAVISLSTHIMGDLSANSITALDGFTTGMTSYESNEITTVDGSVLKLQTGYGAGNIEAFNKNIVMTSDGGIVAAETISAKRFAGSDASRGSVFATQTKINVNQEWDEPPASITLTPEYQASVWVSEISKDGFVINASSINSNKRIFWWAVW